MQDRRIPKYRNTTRSTVEAGIDFVVLCAVLLQFCFSTGYAAAPLQVEAVGEAAKIRSIRKFAKRGRKIGVPKFTQRNTMKAVIHDRNS